MICSLIWLLLVENELIFPIISTNYRITESFLSEYIPRQASLSPLKKAGKDNPHLPPDS